MGHGVYRFLCAVDHRFRSTERSTHAVPPGGYVLGIYVRTDAERDVFKSPVNEIVRGANDLCFEIDDETQEVLNPQGVNTIRAFPGKGIRVWGARTCLQPHCGGT